MTAKTALVAGGTGIIGRRIVEHLIGAGGWNVIGLARRPRNTPKMRWIAVDLHDPADCKHKLGTLNDVTHIFYAARYDHLDGAIDSVEINATMFSNLIVLLDSIAKLRHVHAVHGSKYYGQHLGPLPLPLTEESPRAKSRNFYYEQEDFLRTQSRGKAWSYTTSRPNVLCDAAIDYPRSIGLVIAVYAMIQRELGLALSFPGTTGGFQKKIPFTDTRMLARCIDWMVREPRCANQAFNVVNGDCRCWADLWPRFASNFGIPAGGPSDFILAEYLSDKGTVWDRIVERQNLCAARLETIAMWQYGDRMFRQPWDFDSSIAKTRAYGFDEALDSSDMFAQHFAEYQATKMP